MLILFLFIIGNCFAVTRPASVLLGEFMQFQLPDIDDPLGRICSRQSWRYCLQGLSISSKESNRSGQWTDVPAFLQLITNNNFWLKHNWFSLEPDRHPGACCGSQAAWYQSMGQSKGLSPEEYLNRLTDYSLKDKNLVYIRSRYDHNRHTNVVLSVGFGKGNLSISGTHSPQHNYTIIRKIRTSLSLMYHPLTESQFEVPSESPGSVLTFKIFKTFFICPENPEICRQEQLPNNLGSRIFDIGRKGFGQIY
ncbi:uncharacterized protein LOC142339953 isoform X1 [Convolutriloba macropyga]|uniref:uncharacterized protein LOC142339953 isoform X1 n=1 Tax=Convolutriloba macropyga TaxID=536237 RepID=UPI003F524212